MDRTRERILYFINEYKSEHNGNSPTYQEIADAVGIVKSGVSRHILIMVEAGQLRRQPGTPRSLEVMRQ